MEYSRYYPTQSEVRTHSNIDPLLQSMFSLISMVSRATSRALATRTDIDSAMWYDLVIRNYKSSMLLIKLQPRAPIVATNNTELRISAML